MGVNLGDVVEEGDNILGDGVNIAARLEGLSEAGGICISGTAFDQVRNKLGIGYEYIGEQTVKNIALPVRVYKVLIEPEAAGKVIGEKKPGRTSLSRAVLAGIALVVIAGRPLSVCLSSLRRQDGGGLEREDGLSPARPTFDRRVTLCTI